MPPDLGADEDELADEDQAGQVEQEDGEKEKHFQFSSRLQIRQSLAARCAWMATIGKQLIAENS